MTELIFSIKDIFNSDSQTGCLKQYNSSFYHIPAYQRGFKWSSEKDGAVSVLLSDLIKAFKASKKGKRKEYFLQYITVKRINLPHGTGLEVIDGQQRLTTLSILLSSLANLNDQENIGRNKLEYAIRSNFFKEYIYEKENLTSLIQNSWDQIISQKEEFNKQDIYYIYSAAKKCNSFLKNDIKKDLEGFYEYLISEVKLIVNSVEPHVESETVFKNLNSNKVPLTEAELVKALIITTLGRNRQNQKITNFQEIIEIRSKVGRLWDEIATWSNQPEIKNFYFNNKEDSMQEILGLTATFLERENNLKIKSGEFPIFNSFLDLDDAELVFDTMVKLKNTMDDWFYDPLFYNLIGFNRFAKNNNRNNRSYIIELIQYDSKFELKERLEENKRTLLEKIYLKELNYEETPDNIHHVLLALNVFIEGWKEDTRFNFYAFKNENWSLEHIFPQTPEGKKNVLKEPDKKAIEEILQDNFTAEIEEVLVKPERTDEEKEVYYKALKSHYLLNSIGNMCLMTGADNSSNGNKFFPDKRDNILKLIQKGSFVPKHTFDVFSKMFEGADTNRMTIWSKKDMEKHFNHIEKSLELKLQEIN